MKLFKILFFLVLLNLNFWHSYWEENNNASFRSISYQGYLNDDTLIEVKWKNLSKCDSLKINNTQLKVKEFSDKKITFLFKENFHLKWNILFKCNNKYIEKTFEFPYINKINYFNGNDFSDINIVWKNFNSSSRVSFETKERLKIEKTSLHSIDWKIPKWIKSKKIYITTRFVKNISLLDEDIGITTAICVL